MAQNKKTFVGANKTFLINDTSGQTSGILATFRYGEDRLLYSVEIKDGGYPIPIKAIEELIGLVEREREA